MKSNKKIVAIGLDTHLHEYPWIDGFHCDKYPGSCFFKKFREILEAAGAELRPGREVLQELLDGTLGANNVSLLQFEESLTGKKLLTLGVAPSLLLNLESPLFVTDLYLNLKQQSKHFNTCLGLWTPSHEENESQNMVSARFPSYSNEHRLTRSTGQPLFDGIADFEEKRLASMVVSNKYWRRVGIQHFIRNLVKSSLVGSQPYKRNQIRRRSLHDTRLELISFFWKRSLIDVWGSGWDGRKLPFPFNFDRTLKTFKTEPLPFGGNAKIRAMANYRFALVVENTRHPGYVTEKIFDAFISGTVPIYWGAPDIEKFVPADCFINGSKFPSLSDLEHFMLTMSEPEHQALVANAESFLSSPSGYAHTFEGFGEEVAKLFLNGISRFETTKANG